jgi:hypothetical protein
MTEHKKLPSNLLVIDSEWLEKRIKLLEDVRKVENLHIENIRELSLLKWFKNNSYPLTPILEDVYKKGWLTRDIEGHFSDENCTEYTTNLITLKK